MNFSPEEKKATAALASIYSFRMLGLFMLLPVFSLYAQDQYLEVTPFLIGLAIGIYGLTQALFQIPYGFLSDSVGRKPLIYFGLVLFAGGGVVAALSETIYGVIVGRGLQGSGAIAAVTTALLSDLTREENRTKAMAAIGLSIGLSFMIAMILGPIFVQWLGLAGLFWMTSLLALVGMLVCYQYVPNPSNMRYDYEAQPVIGQVKGVLFKHELQFLNLSIFLLHLILTASFVVIPLVLKQYGGLEGGDHSKVYLSVIGLSFLAMLPLIIVAEKKGKIKEVFLMALAIMSLAMCLLLVKFDNLKGLWVALFLFFFAFNLLEALLPSLVSRLAPAGSKGTALGVYSSGQFLGAFLGGVLGGLLLGSFGYSAIFAVLLALLLCWFYLIWKMPSPRLLQSYVLRIADSASTRPGEASLDGGSLLDSLLKIKGVEEAVVLEEQGVAYLKINKDTLDSSQLEKYSLVYPRQKK